MESMKQNAQQVVSPTENLLILELDRRLELGTLIVEPALSVLDTAACNTADCNLHCCPDTGAPDCP